MSTKSVDRRRGAVSAFLRLGALAMLGGIACTAREARMNGVLVRGTDYAFDVPETLPAGRTAFTFENAGQVPHEMILVRLKEGVTLPQVMKAASGGADPAQFTEGGAAILIAAPGNTTATSIYVDLLPGRTYALVCNFQDGEGKPEHTALGMAKSIQIEAP